MNDRFKTFLLGQYDRIAVNTILVYNLKRRRLAPKMTTSNYHVICIPYFV